MAVKLNAYARYWATAPLPAGVKPGAMEAQGGGVPLWQLRYRVFPRLLFVLTNTGQAGFANRANQLERTAKAPYVARMLWSVPAGVAQLCDLEEHGVGGDVWWPITDLDLGAWSWWELTGTRS